MHSVSDLTTYSRKTTGDVPPRLVGASTTVVGDKMYLFGGRLVTERRMVSDMYVFDLETCVWEKVQPGAEDDVPGARYFHSTEAWKNYLVIFGGMGHKPESENVDELYVLNDVRLFDITTRRWEPVLGSERPSSPSTVTPRARYAHLSAISSSRLWIIGGQDLNNLWLDDLCIFDLVSRQWVLRRPYPRHSGTYRSVAVAGALRVRHPLEEAKVASGGSSIWGPVGTRFKSDKTPPLTSDFTPDDSLIHQPYTTDASDDYPNEIYLYSNYNFTDVKRELEMFTPVPGAEVNFEMSDLSSNMTGAALPPGLRFPTGAICGNYMIFGGTYLAHSYQSFSIWALDLLTMSWSRLDPGAALSTGSWFKGCLWSQPNKSRFVVFGNRKGQLVEDYNRRLLSWDDVAIVDLEAFGIYQPPRLVLDIKAQELGLAALEEELMADFEVVCDDGRKIKCSRKVLENRWPWFKEQRRLFLEAATRALDAIPAAAGDAPLPELPGSPSATDDRQPDPRLTPRSLLLSEPFPITLALLQYFYSMALLTPLQHAPAVLSQLLLLSSTYNLPHLESLARHAMHRALSSTTSVGVYEVATLCSCQSLQIRALKLVMSSSRKAATEGRTHATGGSAGGSGSGRDTSDPNPPSRSRGMSDARPPGGGSNANGNGSSGRTYDTDGDQPNGSGRQLSTNTFSIDREVTPTGPPITDRQRKRQAVLSVDSLYTALQTVSNEMVAEAEETLEFFTKDSPVLERAPTPELPGIHGLREQESIVSMNTSLFAPPTQRGLREQESMASISTSYSATPGHARRPSAPGSASDTESDAAGIVESYSQRSSASNTSSFAPMYVPRLNIARNYSDNRNYSDSDRSLRSSPSMGSLTTSFSSYRTQLSPNTPESPALVTPVTPIEGAFGVPPVVATLSSIEERSSYDEGADRLSFVQMEKKDTTLDNAQLQESTPRETSWVEKDPFASRQESFWATTPETEPVIPSFARPQDGRTHLTSPSRATIMSEDSSSSALYLPKRFFTSKADKEAAKAQAKAEKLERKAREKAERERTEYEMSLWKEEQKRQKSMKQDEKKHKKEQERLRLEKLANDLKAKSKTRDDGSIYSGTSSERRAREGNQWIEKSDGGMYGGLGAWSL